MGRSQHPGVEVPLPHREHRPARPQVVLRATRDDELGGHEYSARKVKGEWIALHREEQGNPADYYNTCLKMAKKRALVDAILTVTAASDIFLPEDDADGYADKTVEDAPPPPAVEGRSPRPPATTGTARGWSRNPREAPVRPDAPGRQDPEQLKVFLKNTYGIDHSSELTMDAYEEVCDWVQ